MKSENVRKSPVTPRQSKALVVLVAGGSQEDAAHAANVDVRSVRRWREEPAFADALREARDAAFAESLDTLRLVTARAITTADELLSHGSASVRLGAMRTVLGVALRTHEAIDFENRLRALETRAAS
jgi:hypothetical protein